MHNMRVPATPIAATMPYPHHQKSSQICAKSIPPPMGAQGGSGQPSRHAKSFFRTAQVRTMLFEMREPQLESVALIAIMIGPISSALQSRGSVSPVLFTAPFARFKLLPVALISLLLELALRSITVPASCDKTLCGWLAWPNREG